MLDMGLENWAVFIVPTSPLLTAEPPRLVNNCAWILEALQDASGAEVLGEVLGAT